MAKQNKPSLGTTIRQNSSGVLAALMCIVIGLVIGLIALFIINPEHALVDGFWRILQGGFYDFPYGCGKVLTQTAPLIMTGLSVAFAFKTGLFNIGAAGQYTLGAFGALRTLELNAQVLLEPVNRLGNAVDERLDEFGVGNAAADGQDGVDEVLLVVFVNGSD